MLKDADVAAMFGVEVEAADIGQAVKVKRTKRRKTID